MGLFDFGSKKITENRVADALPYQELYKDGTVLTRDWGLMKCWHVIYPDVSISTTGPDDVSENIARTFQRRSNSQKDLKTAYWFEIQRLPINLIIDPLFSGEDNMIGADKEIERHRNLLFGDKTKSLVNVCYCCCKVAVKLDENGILPESRRKADETFIELESAMRTIGAKCIELTCTAEYPENNIMVFLKYNSGTENHPFKCPTQGMSDISPFISTKAIDKGKPLRIGDDLVQVMTLQDFPSETYPCILINLLTVPFTFRWTTKWIPHNNKESQDEAKRLRQGFKAGEKDMKTLMYEKSSGEASDNINTQAQVDAAAVEEVMVNLSHGETLGYMTSSIVLFDKTTEGLRFKVSSIHEKLSAVGFDAIEETVYSNYDAWKASLPGDTVSGKRRPLVTATNISHIIPFTDIYHGGSTDFYLKRLTGIGWPHLMGKLQTQEIFYLNLNGPHDDVGHCFIIGVTGGGKSVLLSLLGSQWSRYPKSRVILFDKDMSFSNICERTGGAIYVPGADDSPLKFMPLSRIKTKPHQAVEWLELAIESAGTTATPEISQDLFEVAKSWDDSIPSLERFSKRLKGHNPDSPALAALDKILESDILANLFGGTEDSFTNENFKQKTMIEMGQLMNLGNMAILPALKFIFDRLDELFDSEYPQPTLLVLDEAWIFLGHKVFRKKIKEWLKTLRKKRVFVVFALQNVNDIDDPEEFLTSCHTKIYLANPELKGEGSEDIKTAYHKMGVTDAEMLIIGNARKKRDYFIQQLEGSALVDFCVDSYQLERLAKDGQ